MAVIEINHDPSRKELRWFGAIVALFCGVVGAVLKFRFDLDSAAEVAWIVGVALAVVFYAVPPVRRPMYVGWMYLFFPLGFVLAHIVLGIIYFLVLTPIGLLLRLSGRDSMQRSFDPDAETYWVKRETNIPFERYFRQF